MTTTLQLDAAGFALTQLPPGTAASIRAYDAKDHLIGETVVPPLENSGDGVPGARRATRLVD